MRTDLSTLENARRQAHEFIDSSGQFLVITCAEPKKHCPPRMAVALPEDNTLIHSLSFLMTQIPNFRNAVKLALEKSISVEKKLN